MYIISILTIINSYQPLIGRCHGMTIPFGVYDSAVPPWWAEATQRHAPRRDPRTERFFALENVGQLRSHGTVMEQSWNSQTEQSWPNSSRWVMLGPQRSLKASLCDRILRQTAWLFSSSRAPKSDRFLHLPWPAVHTASPGALHPRRPCKWMLV